jgi:hypothetical protein
MLSQGPREPVNHSENWRRQTIGIANIFNISEFTELAIKKHRWRCRGKLGRSSVVEHQPSMFNTLEFPIL